MAVGRAVHSSKEGSQWQQGGESVAVSGSRELQQGAAAGRAVRELGGWGGG